MLLEEGSGHKPAAYNYFAIIQFLNICARAAPPRRERRPGGRAGLPGGRGGLPAQRGGSPPRRRKCSRRKCTPFYLILDFLPFMLHRCFGLGRSMIL